MHDGTLPDVKSGKTPDNGSGTAGEPDRADFDGRLEDPVEPEIDLSALRAKFHQVATAQTPLSWVSSLNKFLDTEKLSPVILDAVFNELAKNPLFLEGLEQVVVPETCGIGMSP